MKRGNQGVAGTSLRPSPATGAPPAPRLLASLPRKSFLERVNCRMESQFTLPERAPRLASPHAPPDDASYT
jgi:hypothetical protein